MSIKLPKTKQPVLHKEPRSILIMAKPKVGKTELAASLENNLLIDVNDGSGFVECMRVTPKTWKEFTDIIKQVKEEGNPYDFITIDTIGDLEEMCIDLAEHLYSKTNPGKNWYEKGGGKEKYGSILNMPDGAGYLWLREAVKKMIDYAQTATKHLILLAHVRQIDYSKNDRKEVEEIEVDLTGKLRNIVPADVDAVGYMYRKRKNENYINFEASKKVISGNRGSSLSGEVLLSVLKENGELETHWEEIFKESLK